MVKALLNYLDWIAFEPNSPALWSRITDSLGSLLQGFYGKGFLQGTSPAEAFFVQCDDETNPPEVIDQGEVITRVGLALLAPAEFIVITIRRNVGRISLSEE